MDSITDNETETATIAGARQFRDRAIVLVRQANGAPFRSPNGQLVADHMVEHIVKILQTMPLVED